MQGIDAYEENADNLLLEQFVTEHKLLVKKIALHMKRRLPSHIELEDLLQSGFVGLLEARSHFKEDMGATFETFASIRIKGAMIDSLRKNSWGNREVIKNMRVISEAIARLEQRLQKQPSTDEIAKELEISIEDYLDMCQQISLCNILSLDMINGDAALIDNGKENPDEVTEQQETLNLLKETLAKLPEREQLVLSLYYIEEFTFKQIAEVLELTEARICQLHSQAILRIKNRIPTEAIEFV